MAQWEENTPASRFQQLAAMEEHAKELGTAVLKAVTPDK